LLEIYAAAPKVALVSLTFSRKFTSAALCVGPRSKEEDGGQSKDDPREESPSHFVDADATASFPFLPLFTSPAADDGTGAATPARGHTHSLAGTEREEAKASLARRRLAQFPFRPTRSRGERKFRPEEKRRDAWREKRATRNRAGATRTTPTSSSSCASELVSLPKGEKSFFLLLTPSPLPAFSPWGRREREERARLICSVGNLSENCAVQNLASGGGGDFPPFSS